MIEEKIALLTWEKLVNEETNDLEEVQIHQLKDQEEFNKNADLELKFSDTARVQIIPKGPLFHYLCKLGHNLIQSSDAQVTYVTGCPIFEGRFLTTLWIL